MAHGLHALYEPETKRVVRDAITALERETSAEVVVTVRRASASYRHADYLGGATVALATLCLFLYHPEPFDYTYFPLEQAVSFVLGALATNAFTPARRLLTGRSFMATCVKTAARASFVELGAGKTRGRNGVLVYVSTFEKAVEVVCDVGIDESKLGAAWVDAKKKLERSIRLDEDPDLFAAALKDLGAALARRHPRAADDENELSDELAHEDEEGDADDEDEDEAAPISCLRSRSRRILTLAFRGSRPSPRRCGRRRTVSSTSRFAPRGGSS